MSQHKSEDYKISAVNYYLVGDKTQKEVCNIFKCSERSLMRWVEKYENDGEIKRYNREPIAYKIQKSHVKFILNEIKNNKTITLETLLANLKHKFPSLTLSKVHLSRIIHDNNISLKITRLRHEPTKRFGKDININDNLKLFYEKIKEYNLNDIICIDETSINALQIRHHCYSDIGKRCVVKTESQEVFKKYTGIFAISTHGVIGYELYDKGGIETNRLSLFLGKFILHKYKNKLIVLDNASSHRNAKIKELINKNNELIHSVPYQHFTNAIENFFSVLKSKLQKLNGLQYKQLVKNIQLAIDVIPKIYYKKIINGSYNNPTVYDNKHTSRRHSVKKYLP